jgi:signal transduction histidine kinase
MIICTNVTERKNAEAAVQKEQELLRQLLELHERDRKLLAFELHDGFAQQLTGAVLNLEAAAQAHASDPGQAEQSFQTGIRLLRESIEESRRLVSGLRPPVLDEFGIVPAIEHLIEESGGAEGPQVRFVAKGRFRRLARPLETAIFRIVQESLSNARRHSHSRLVDVELAREDQTVRVSVRDWGVGFDPRQVDEHHFGLRGIRERARLLGGEAAIDAAPGKGTWIRVRLPIVERIPGQPAPGDPVAGPGGARAEAVPGPDG